ncbi:uncharacterized protein LOC132593066 isoform X2 [Zootoca vivipara]|uniref:uncharacterized protein LOC132593066 isoform X2 n=1 Tax=Zootoca vivipara TaxID=8524 RepID=UPI00293BC657|nr:uncharacterized protein LOC132593066 isoform X2 [Zootoca vivipara]
MKFAALITACLRILLWSSVHAGTPPAAILSLDPQHHIYIRDEKVILTCLAPDSLKVAGYTFFKQQQDQTLKELPNSRMGPYEMFRVNEGTVGSYSCVYWIMLSRREIFSPHSNLVFVAMADPPPFPVLKVDPPSGVVNEGGSLRLTCLADGTTTEKRFHFFKDGAEMATSNEGSREPANTSPNASVSILQAKVKHSGEFACSYEEEIGGRWIMSQWSKTGKVVVYLPDQGPYSSAPSSPTPNPTPSLGYLRSAPTFLILMVPLAFC